MAFRARDSGNFNPWVFIPVFLMTACLGASLHNLIIHKKYGVVKAQDVVGNQSAYTTTYGGLRKKGVKEHQLKGWGVFFAFSYN